ncbi:hypothetical protein Msip34_0558 [Methylovorus glucosotrophus SIP3-4]|jgi:hypothetical protein|uniref:Uncharacterized protein n=2 Tax=Methylophilaceae TaxID=32011 RepID=C6X9I6_METGS|nr:hypothetical protein Msip34_0558 [Methylovorus glucosotrophus SIP3-4]
MRDTPDTHVVNVVLMQKITSLLKPFAVLLLICLLFQAFVSGQPMVDIDQARGDAQPAVVMALSELPDQQDVLPDPELDDEIKQKSTFSELDVDHLSSLYLAQDTSRHLLVSPLSFSYADILAGLYRPPQAIIS